jgi:PPM family protein phosphatase
MPLRFCSATDMGRRRSVNQDSLVADPGLRLFAIADGMGGHDDGDMASRLVIDSLHQFVVQTQADEEKTWPFEFDLQLSYPANRLKAAIRVANRRISEHLATAGTARGMGATLAAALLGPDWLVVANVGDCRAYLLQDGQLRQLTRDHSWVADQVASGFITPETAKAHPWRHMVTRAIQGDGDLEVDTLEVNLAPAVRLLLCSDGLHAVLSDEQIAAILNDAPDDPHDACGRLIQAANDGGGPDNVSAIVIDSLAEDPVTAQPPLQVR